LLFPDGRLPSRRWRPIGWAAGLGLAALILGLAAHPGPLSDWNTAPNPYGIAGAEKALAFVITAASLLLAIGLAGSIVAVIVRFRRSRGIERAQMKWLVFAAIVVLVLAVFTVPLWRTGGLEGRLAMELSIVLTNLVTLGIAMAVTVAILRYRLYDIDILINRTLVYSIMTGVVWLIYGLIVGAAGVLFQSQGNWFIALLATALVAVLFQPIRDRLQRAVNRLLYGQRDEPFEVLARLGQRLEQTLSPDAVYPAIVETVAHALHLPYVGLCVRDGDGFRVAESYGRLSGEPISYPLTYQGESVGQLLVDRRGAEDGEHWIDERLLRNIARQAGVAVHSARLTTDLQRSRQQIVTSREEERRRLRRDLHDGLGPSLASLLIEARVLRRMIRADPAAADRLAVEMQGDIRTTIDDVRRVVQELRPTALDDLGLVAALNVLARKISQPEGVAGAPTSLQVQIDAPDDLPPLPAAVEVATYRIVQEALTNVVHHAHARCAIVRVSLNQGLAIEIADDGIGFSAARDEGVGLHSMRERASELGGSLTVARQAGGGTIVRAVLPLPEGP
jgi:signal transduction histidine kinase